MGIFIYRLARVKVRSPIHIQLPFHILLTINMADLIMFTQTALGTTTACQLLTHCSQLFTTTPPPVTMAVTALVLPILTVAYRTAIIVGQQQHQQRKATNTMECNSLRLGLVVEAVRSNSNNSLMLSSIAWPAK